MNHTQNYTRDNREIYKDIRKDIRKYTNEPIVRTIDENKSDKRRIFQLKDKNINIVSERQKILHTESNYRSAYVFSFTNFQSVNQIGCINGGHQRTL